MNPCNISPTYTAIRFGLHGLFEEIETLDPDISPLVDTGETIRIMLADYFYSDHIKPEGTTSRTVRVDDRVIVFKEGTKQKDVAQFDHHIETLRSFAEKFWNLSDYLYGNVLKATQDYTHPPSDCFYQYSAKDKAINVYLPHRSGLPAVTGLLPASAVIHACLSTLPTFLKQVLNVMVPAISMKEIEVDPRSKENDTLKPLG